MYTYYAISFHKCINVLFNILLPSAIKQILSTKRVSTMSVIKTLRDNDFYGTIPTVV